MSRPEESSLHPARFLPRRDDHVVRRFAQLGAGLVLYGVSMALLVTSGLGVMPWDVLHQGLARRTGISMGVISILVGIVVLLCWIPLKQWPAVGTVANVFVIGLALDGALAGLGRLPDVLPMAVRIVLMGSGIALNAVATGAYIGARLGPGPRDGLMTGLVRRTGASVRSVRTTLEVVVVVIGWLLGGTLGLGTVAYALGIGPLVHLLLPRLTVPAADHLQREVPSPQVA